MLDNKNKSAYNSGRFARACESLTTNKRIKKMFTVCNTIDKFLRECYFNNKLIKYIDSTYAHNIPNNGKFWVSLTKFNGAREVKTFELENELNRFLFLIDFSNLEKIKISTKDFDLMVIDRASV